jgi:predicted ATPase
MWAVGEDIYGRDVELALVRGELERVADGAEVVVVVEGAAGMGKSRLLAEVAVIARSLGVKVGGSAADPSETVVELAALLAALFDGAEPLLDPGSLIREWAVSTSDCRSQARRSVQSGRTRLGA